MAELVSRTPRSLVRAVLVEELWHRAEDISDATLHACGALASAFLREHAELSLVEEDELAFEHLMTDLVAFARRSDASREWRDERWPLYWVPPRAER